MHGHAACGHPGRLANKVIVRTMQVLPGSGALCATAAPRAPAGDLFTALLLGWMHRHPGDRKSALEAAGGGLQAVLRDTVAACGDTAAATERTAVVSAARELRLVQNQAALAAPPRLCAAEPVGPA